MPLVPVSKILQIFFTCTMRDSLEQSRGSFGITRRTTTIILVVMGSLEVHGYYLGWSSPRAGERTKGGS